MCYDKRGVGLSTGIFDSTVTSEDFARDALAGVDYLKTRKEIDPKRIGLIGASEGGMIAPMVVTHSDDIAFLVLLAGLVTTSIDSLIEQIALQLRADGAPEDLIAHNRKVRNTSSSYCPSS